MTKIVTSLEICANSIRFLQADASSENSTPLCHAVVPFTSLDELTEKLIKLSSKYGISKSSFISVLPRHQVFQKRITVPPGNYAEVSSMLHYEAERYLPFSTDSAVIDFYPVKPLTDTEPNEICLVAAKRETVEKQLAILSSAGLFPDSISTTSLAIANLFNNSETIAFLRFDNDCWEIVILTQGDILVSRGFPLSNAIDTREILPTIKNEIKNTFNMACTADPSVKIDKILYTCSGKDTDFISVLQTELNITLIKYELSNSLSGELLVPSGLVASRERQINLLPKDILEVVAKKRRNKRQFLTIATTVVVLLLGLGSFLGYNYYRSAANRALMKTIELNKRDIIELARQEKYLETIDQFKNNNTLSLDILREISQTMPEGVYIRQFSYDYSENTVTLRGRASSFAVASRTISQLGKSKYFTQVTNKGSYAIKVGEKDLVDFELLCSLRREYNETK